ncbi:MAG: ImuA family protein [Roseomonas sp.]
MTAADPLSPRSAALARLRDTLAGLSTRAPGGGTGAPIPVFADNSLIDAALARGALHEVCAVSPGSGVAFAAILLARCGGQVLWIATEQESNLVWPPGLVPFGLAPDKLILARAARFPEALWAMEEALRCPALGAAVLMAGSGQGLDLTATRRLHLAAEAGGVFGLLLRPEGAAGASAARTRWHIAPLASADAPRWRLSLLRQRGGAPAGPWQVAFNAATNTLHLEAGGG